AELEREGDQPLLRAVVKVALQGLVFLVACLEQARAGAFELLESRSKHGVEAAVLQRHSGRRPDGVEQMWLVIERSVMDQCCDVRAVSLAQGRSPSLSVGQVDFSPIDI